MYSNTYTISSLSVNDDGRTYRCEVIIDANPPVVAASNLTLHITFPAPEVSITPSGPIQGAMVGSPQDIRCTVSTGSRADLSSVMISWIGPGGDTITNDSRVTISPTSGSGNNYTSSLQFMYLMEGDEDKYICDVVILGTVAYGLLEISSLNSKLMCLNSLWLSKIQSYKTLNMIHSIVTSCNYIIVLCSMFPQLILCRTNY